MLHIHNQVPVMEAVKTVRCQETWNTAALDVFAKHVGNNCKGIHLLVASNIYKDDSFTDILQTFCFKWNQIVSRCILEYI